MDGCKAYEVDYYAVLWFVLITRAALFLLAFT